jgi:hypothetical protein
MLIRLYSYRGFTVGDTRVQAASGTFTDNSHGKVRVGAPGGRLDGRVVVLRLELKVMFVPSSLLIFSAKKLRSQKQKQMVNFSTDF